MTARLLLQPPCHEQSYAEPHQRNQDQPADELRERELPPDEDPDHDPELEDEVRRGELEHHRRREARSLGEHRLRDRDRRVATRGGRRAEPRRERDLPWPAAPEGPLARSTTVAVWDRPRSR